MEKAFVDRMNLASATTDVPFLQYCRLVGDGNAMKLGLQYCNVIQHDDSGAGCNAHYYGTS
jgi:hypothetical protein